MSAAAAMAERVRAAADALWQIKLEHPYLRLANGLPVDSLPAGSQEEARHDASRATQLLDSLNGIDATLLSETDRLTCEFLRHDLVQRCDAELDWLHGSAVAPFSSLHFSYYAQHLLGHLTIDSAAALERAVCLWTDLAAALRGVAERLAVQRARGWHLAQPAIAPTLEHWKRLRAALLATLEASLSRGSAPWLVRWHAHAAELRSGHLEPSFDAVITALADPQAVAAAPAEVGLVHQPGGADEYLRCIAMHLTLAQDPQRIHATGLEEVQRLSERMREVRSRLGFNGSEAESHARLRSDPRVIARSAAEVAERYLRCVGRITPLLPGWFERLPRSPFAVERLAPEQEAGMSYGYYDRPRAAGERGIYRYNAGDLANRLQLQVAALIYHEGLPGHHLHIAGQIEADHLPQLRRNALEISIYNEGWAEYASGLAESMGLYDDAYDLYGRLVHERFTAQRLVVDSGLNALGWSLERARAFMREHTLEGEAQIASETLRYATDMPAQALAYRLGYLWFTQLRDDTAARLGARFDVRAFHAALLDEGALPVDVLRAHVARVLR
jgi:uncharacterized protein (DUF885 family)